jgi:hypothetical protein
MYCPICRGEFRAGYTHCDECDADLVEVLPDDPEEDMVPVLQTSDPFLLSMARSALDNEGIPFVVQGEEASGLFPVDAVVLVTPDQEEEARTVIDELDGIHREEEEEV